MNGSLTATSGRRRYLVGAGAFLLSISVLFLLARIATEARAGASSSDDLSGVTVSIASGLKPVMTASQIATVAVARLQAMSAEAGDSAKAVAIDIQSISAVIASDVVSLEPAAGPAPESEADQIVWVVRAKGPFYTRRTPPGVDAISNVSGYLLYADASGDPIGMGMP